MPRKKKDEELKILKEQLARALADYDNLQKRMRLGQEQQRYIIKAQIIGGFLPVFDMLYGAQKHLNDSGLGLAIKELEESLASEGLEKICPECGEPFTENLHEAVEVAKDDAYEDGVVVECMLVGWKFIDGNVIRHAKVRVNKKS